MYGGVFFDQFGQINTDQPTEIPSDFLKNLGCLPSQEIVHLFGQAGQTQYSLFDTGIELLSQERQQFMAYAVAGGLELKIGMVNAPSLRFLEQELFYSLRLATQEGSDNSNFWLWAEYSTAPDS